MSLNGSTSMLRVMIQQHDGRYRMPKLSSPTAL
jgi:hypothetical protein